MTKHLRYLCTLLLLAVVSLGWGETVTISYSGSTTTNMTGNNDAVSVGLSESDWSVIGSKGGASNFPGLNKDGTIRLYANSGNGSFITVKNLVGNTISSITLNVNSGTASVLVGSTEITGNDNVYAINSSSFVVANHQSTGQVQISSIVITYTVSATTSISAENVTIDANETSGSITYGINNGEAGAVVEAQVLNSTIANLVIDDNITSTSVPFTCDANSETQERSATVRLTYGNATKDVTITQGAYVETVSGYVIDFENDLKSYVDWTFDNIGNSNTAIDAHGGSKYGANINSSGNGVTTASITTKSAVANPTTFTCYVSKTSTNTTSSTWYVEVSTDGDTWTEVKSQSAISMNKGVWTEVTANLGTYKNVFVRLRYDGSNAVRTVDDISIVEGGKMTATVTIDKTALNIDETATVTTDGPTVELTTSDATIASVNGNTVTGVAAGTATITATWSENDLYEGGTKQFTITVKDPNAPGSENNPYTVTQALEADPANEVYVRGIVSGITEISTQYGNATYTISADGTNEGDQLLIYRGKYLNNTSFTEETSLLVGDIVIIFGNLSEHNEVNQMAQNNYIVSLTHPEKPKHNVSFSVNGVISSTAEVQEEESIEFPSDPDDIYGKTFVGWIGSTINGVTDTAPEFVTSATMGTEDVTFYAVFANEIPGEVTEITDVLTRATTGVTGTSYSNWSGKTATSSAVYAGNSAGGNSSIQLRSQNPSSIITTQSGGTLKKVTVVWNSNTANGRTLRVYGKNTAYSQPSDTYNPYEEGDKIGEVVCGTSTELTIEGNYTFFSMRSMDGAMYLSSISVIWKGESAATYSAYCTTVPVPDPVTVTISDAGYSTLYYGDRNLVVPANMEAYTVKVTTQVERSTTYNAGDVIPAGTGVVLKANQGPYTFIVSATEGEKDNNNMLKGSDEPAETTGGTYYYALTLNKNGANPGFYWMVDGGGAFRNGTHKAYLALNSTFTELANGTTGGSKGFLALPDGDTDGIGLIENGNMTMENGEIYNLAGQRVNKAQKGIYIVNGKKIVIK